MHSEPCNSVFRKKKKGNKKISIWSNLNCLFSFAFIRKRKISHRKSKFATNHPNAGPTCTWKAGNTLRAVVWVSGQLTSLSSLPQTLPHFPLPWPPFFPFPTSLSYTCSTLLPKTGLTSERESIKLWVLFVLKARVTYTNRYYHTER